MNSIYSDVEAKDCVDDLDLRVYTSILLGKDENLVLHGGGNTSVKTKVNDEDIIYIKGSGWDLATIERDGFAPVRLQALLDMAKLEALSDTQMVKMQKEAMIDKTSPNPSIEAILHAIIPFKYVDHTHADAIVTISNTPNGYNYIKEIYSDFLIVPYIMPGFLLAKEIYNLTKDIDWSNISGIILLNHGIFTFDDDPRVSYEKMIQAVTKAEEYLEKNAKLTFINYQDKEFDYNSLKRLISRYKGYEAVLHINNSLLAKNFANSSDLAKLSRKGILTPEHIIRTKRFPIVINSVNIQYAITDYIKEYTSYFDQYKTEEIMLNPAPNWAIIRDVGVVSFGKSATEASIINDIITHTMEAILRGEKLGGYKCINLKDGFDMEYWELEQAKLRK